MASTSKYTVPFRRKREGKTNYKKRLELVKSGLPRLVVRKTNTKVIAQIMQFDPNGDKVISYLVSTELKKHGWKHSCASIPAAYLTGLLLGKKTGKLADVIVDLGLQTPHKKGRLYAFIKGVVDAGIPVRASEEVFPDEDRLLGKHINESVATEVAKIKQKILG
ncbi:MAG: 50S ribosomal protein L18 [Candidatus Woesearchaeota archaeon]|nr:MAG: 50S ribosomal protein L18 [Candidatus Woesearchaeota archaeon]